MAKKVYWQPKLNALTTPRSYKAQVVPTNFCGYDEISEGIANKNPIWSAGLVKAILLAEREEIIERLINGDQVSLERWFTYHLTIKRRLQALEEELPPDKRIVKLNGYASKTAVQEVQDTVELERLAPEVKLPVLESTEDTVLHLKDVLNSNGLLRLTGTNLLFHTEDGDGECVIEGTANGRTVQTRFGDITNTLLFVLPDIPGQTQPWQNEYRISVSTRYTEHGTLRTGIYPGLLRTPLSVNLSADDGILSGGPASTPLARVTGGHLTAEGARVRIQALVDAQDGDLRLSLLDMTENGAVGNAVTASSNGVYTLPGYTGADVTTLEVTLLDYAALVTKAREQYAGRLVDILDVSGGS